MISRTRNPGNGPPGHNEFVCQWYPHLACHSCRSQHAAAFQERWPISRFPALHMTPDELAEYRRRRERRRQRKRLAAFVRGILAAELPDAVRHLTAGAA